MRDYTVEDLFYMSNDAKTPKELNKGDTINIGAITKVDGMSQERRTCYGSQQN